MFVPVHFSVFPTPLGSPKFVPVHFSVFPTPLGSPKFVPVHFSVFPTPLGSPKFVPVHFSVFPTPLGSPKFVPVHFSVFPTPLGSPISVQQYDCSSSQRNNHTRTVSHPLTHSLMSCVYVCRCTSTTHPMDGSQVARCVDEEGLVHPWVIHIMADGCQNGCKILG